MKLLRLVISVFSLTFFSSNFSGAEPLGSTKGTTTESILIGGKNEDVSRPGSPLRSSRIINGTTSVVGYYPFMVALAFSYNATTFLFCGSSIYDKDYVITAAHCVTFLNDTYIMTGFTEIKITLYFGKWILNQAEVGEDYRYFKKVIIHPEYDNVTLQNDIALLKLETPLEFSDKIQPICMPQSPVLAGEETFVLGWGDSRGSANENYLQHAVMPVIAIENCTSAGWMLEDYILDGMFCAGHEAGGIDACQGDSGGPLVREVRDHRFELAGIVSWGIGCALPKKPSVFTDVFYYLDWIQEC